MFTQTEQVALLCCRGLEQEQGHAHQQLVQWQLLQITILLDTAQLQLIHNVCLKYWQSLNLSSLEKITNSNVIESKKSCCVTCWQVGRSCCIKLRRGRQSPFKLRQRWEAQSSCRSSPALSVLQRFSESGTRPWSRASTNPRSSSTASTQSTCQHGGQHLLMLLFVCPSSTPHFSSWLLRDKCSPAKLTYVF